MKRACIYARFSSDNQRTESIDAQIRAIREYCVNNKITVVKIYADKAISGTSTDNREEFLKMIKDSKSDLFDYVIVHKLDRFARNRYDQAIFEKKLNDNNVKIISVLEQFNDSPESVILKSVLTGMSEYFSLNLSREVKKGKNENFENCQHIGGTPPLGLDVDKETKLYIINEEEAKTVRLIYELYVHKKMGGRLIAQYLESHDIKKLSHKNTRGDMFAAAYIQDILRNPTYCGKIAYGRRKQEKVHGTRNDYRIVWNDDYLLTDGIHQPIVSVEDWEEAQARLRSQATKYKRYDRQENEHAYLLTGIIKCPECGAGMYVSKSVKKRPDGSYYKEFRYYGCKHRRMDKGQKCTFKNQLPMELMDQAVAEVIVSLVSRPDFAAMMAEKINAEIDISALLEEIAHYEKQLRQQYAVKDRLAEDIDQLDPDDRHYQRRKSDLEERLYKMYDKIEETEEHLIEARAKKQAIDADRITRDNILSILMNFEKLYSVMSDIEKRDLMATMIADIQVYPQRQPNGQWLKSIHFKLPLIAEEELQFSLDKKDWLENVMVLAKL